MASSGCLENSWRQPACRMEVWGAGVWVTAQKQLVSPAASSGTLPRQVEARALPVPSPTCDPPCSPPPQSPGLFAFHEIPSFCTASRREPQKPGKPDSAARNPLRGAAGLARRARATAHARSAGRRRVSRYTSFQRSAQTQHGPWEIS